MADKSEYTYMSCGREPETRSLPADQCDFCTPRVELTSEEEAILARMRAIKERVRPIAARLNELHDRFERPPGDETSPETRSEWDELSVQLAEFRAQWNDWQAKLDQAIENKLVFLGHH
jgi:hypothetical protein